MFSCHLHLIELQAKFQFSMNIKKGIVWYKKHAFYDTSHLQRLGTNVQTIL
jgi:hypothetical protein